MDLSNLSPVIDLLASFGGGGSSSGGGGGGGGFSGGSSSSGSGSGEFNPWVFGIFVIGFLLSSVFGMVKARRYRAQRRADEVIQYAVLEQRAPGWTEATLESYVSQMIVTLNNAWSALDAPALESHLTPRYYEKMRAMIEALTNAGRRNRVDGVSIGEIVLLHSWDRSDTQPAGCEFQVVMSFEEDALERLDGTVISTNPSSIVETWTLESDGARWRLANVMPATVAATHYQSLIEEFAQQNGLFFSADFGRMLLPERGQLFDGSSLETSDVNNHVIGYLDDRLIQLYTYVSDPRGRADDQITVVQSLLPREYRNIVVRRRTAREWKRLSRSGLKEMETESMAFQDRWAVWAHPDDDIATFELLNPAYIERLTGLPYPVTIEVVGHDLFIFTEEHGVPYADMFDLLKAAFRELER